MQTMSYLILPTWFQIPNLIVVCLFLLFFNHYNYGSLGIVYAQPLSKVTVIYADFLEIS